MKTILSTFLLVSHSLFAAATTETPAIPPPFKGASTPAYLMLPIKDRAADLQQAFEQLRKEKATGKVYFQLADGTNISNIIDMTLLSNSTLALLRYNTSNNQGIKIQVVKIEDIAGVSYY